jgi:predicted HicB family RNase H-like nuclease
MPISEARARANKKWDAENTERINLIVRKGFKAQIKAAADAAGESLNGYIIAAAKKRMESEGLPVNDIPEAQKAEQPEGES